MLQKAMGQMVSELPNKIDVQSIDKLTPRLQLGAAYAARVAQIQIEHRAAQDRRAERKSDADS